MAALRRSFTLARRTSNVEDVVRAASQPHVPADYGWPLHRGARGGAGRAAGSKVHGRTAGAYLSRWTTTPPERSTLTGRWRQADQLLAEVIGESEGTVTSYLELVQLELAVGRGDIQQAAKLAAVLEKTPPDPGLIGPLHACLAEQALYAGDLATAAGEVLDGLAALAGTGWSEEEIRLLAVGARVAADLAALPAGRGRRTFRSPGRRRRPPSTTGRRPSRTGTARGGRASPPSGRRRTPSTHATTAPMTRPPGAPWLTHGGWLASHTGRRTRVCARQRPRPGLDSASKRLVPWPRARPWPANSPRLPCSTSPVSWRGVWGWRLGLASQRALRRFAPGFASPAARPRVANLVSGAATGRLCTSVSAWSCANLPYLCQTLVCRGGNV